MHSLSAFARSGYVLLALATCFPPAIAEAQIGSGRVRPFVTGIIPVVGSRGQVGGVIVDAKGAVLANPVIQAPALQRQRQQALAAQSTELQRASKLRKVSLRRLQLAIRKLGEADQGITDEIQFLAGLQRVEFLFLDPDNEDIIIAGPAEGWRVNNQGQYVGIRSGTPVLQLDDLVVALRSAVSDESTVISCSIDPTAAGLQRFQSALQAGNPPSLRKLRNLLGDQTITIKGLSPTTHLARVLVAADVRMKRLAMNMEKAPLPGMPSYLQLLRKQRPRSQTMTPRWWLAPNYQPIERDELGLTWRVRGPGLKVLTKSERLMNDGTLTAEQDPAAELWAKRFSERFPQLAGKMEIFASLRGCMDLAMTAALINTFELDQLGECDLSLLTADKPLVVTAYPPARAVATRASLVSSGNSQIVALSGGVEFPLAKQWKVVENAKLADRRSSNLTRRSGWWWD